MSDNTTMRIHRALPDTQRLLTAGGRCLWTNPLPASAEIAEA